MAISSGDIKYYLPATINKAGTNGGKRSYTECPTSIAGVIPAVSVAEATAGGTFWTKFFIKLENTDDEPLLLSQFGIVNAPSGDDQYSVCAGTHSDTQTEVAAYTSSLFACGGSLYAAITAGASTFQVTCELTAYGIQTSRNYMITDGTHTEVFAISNVSWSGTRATVTVDSGYNSGNGLKYSYATSGTYCGSLLNIGTVTTSWTQVANPNSITITGDVITYNAGTIYDEFIVEFQSSTTYRVAKTSAPTTYLATGQSISSACSVQNPDETTGNYLFTIPAGFFGGTITTGNTYTFSTTPAEIPVWVKRVVPAGAASGQMTPTFKLIGESV